MTVQERENNNTSSVAHIFLNFFKAGFFFCTYAAMEVVTISKMEKERVNNQHMQAGSVIRLVQLSSQLKYLPESYRRVF